MRRLVALVSAVVLVDTMLYAALGPLLPGYADDYGLSKTGAGILVALYAVGVLLGALPSGLASARFGRRTITVAGLVVMGVSSVGFAFATDEWTLGLSRLLQGFGGELLGIALGGAIFGAMLGPAVGGLAAIVGEEPTFVGVGLVNGALALLALRSPDAPHERAYARAIPGAF